MTDGLRRGALLEICIDLYRRHPANGAGGCTTCATRTAPCATRRNCEKVLLAAGLNPTKFTGSVNLIW